MFVEVNGRLLDYKDYSERLKQLKQVLESEFSELAETYGFKEINNLLVNKELNLAINIEFQRINYLKEI